RRQQWATFGRLSPPPIFVGRDHGSTGSPPIDPLASGRSTLSKKRQRLQPAPPLVRPRSAAEIARCRYSGPHRQAHPAVPAMCTRRQVATVAAALLDFAARRPEEGRRTPARWVEAR